MKFEKVFKISIFLTTLFAMAILMSGTASALTFGSDTELTSTSTFTAFDGWITGTEYSLSEKADVQSISAWLNFAENGLTRAGIYDSGDNLVATSTIYENTSGNTGDVLIAFTFTENPVLEIGNYWLVVYAFDTDVLSYMATGTSGETWEFEMEQEDLIFPETFGQSYAYAEETFIFATYEIYREPYVSIPANFGSLALAYAGQLFTDLNLIIVLTIGLPVGFWVIKKVISLV